MNNNSILGSALGQLGQAVKQGAKQIVKLPEELAKDASGQVGGSKPTEQKPQEQKQEWKSDEERVKFLRDLYGPSQNKTQEQAKKPENKQSTTANPLITTEKKPSEFEEQIKDKSPEEQKKLMELRNQLHKENYYDPTFNPKNPPAGGEERPAEKVENEKKQETVDLQKKEEKKPPPLAAQRAAQRVENLPGAG